MQGVVLVGHGSLRRGAGAAMIRLAQRLREVQVAPIVAAGFLNYSRPTFAEAVERCVARGAREIVVQPYFLVPGVFVANDLPQLVAAARLAHPLVAFRSAAALGDHAALASLTLRRADATLSSPSGQAGSRDGLLLMAHGSPDTSTLATIAAIAERIRLRRPALRVLAGYLDLNTPRIDQAIDQLVADGVSRLIAVPYFLQLGRHVARDLPAILSAARQRHPAINLLLAAHLGYDPLLATVLVDRIQAALSMKAEATPDTIHMLALAAGLSGAK